MRLHCKNEYSHFMYFKFAREMRNKYAIFTEHCIIFKFQDHSLRDCVMNSLKLNRFYKLCNFWLVFLKEHTSNFYSDLFGLLRTAGKFTKLGLIL